MKMVEEQKSVRQSLWLAHFSRRYIRDESLRDSIDDWSITGIALSPQAISQALSDTDAYDHAIANTLKQGIYGPPSLYRLIFEDVRRAADLLRSVHDKTDGLDGWAVMPVSPLFSNEYKPRAAEYKQILDQIERPNVLLLLPVVPEHLAEVEEFVSAGMPINIVNVYSANQFCVVAQVCLAGIQRRLEAGDTRIGSIFISIDISLLVMELQRKVTRQRAKEGALAMARTIYRAWCDFHNSPEWGSIAGDAIQPLRLVWAHSEDLQKAEIDLDFYGSLIAPHTSVSLPHDMIARYSAHIVDDDAMPADGGDGDQILTDFARAGSDIDSEADNLQLGYFNWLLREWALVLENFARKSARVVQREKVHHLVDQRQ